MNIEEKPIYKLAEILNEMSVQVLGIDGEYFAVSEFFPADRNTPYHRLKGRVITKILNDSMNMGIQDRTSTRQKIESCTIRDIQYSGDYQWKWFIQ